MRGSFGSYTRVISMPDSSLYPSTVRVCSMPSLMSTSPSGAWSMFEYDLTASTSPEMRPTLASASASRSAVVTVAPRYSNTLGSASPGTVASTSPSQPVPSAASAKTGAKSHPSSRPRALSQPAILPSRSSRASGSRKGGEAAHVDASFSRAARISSSSGVSAHLSFIASFFVASMFPRRLLMARRLAAAGLLSSWASPAARLLREFSLSRWPATCWRIWTRWAIVSRIVWLKAGETVSMCRKASSGSRKKRQLVSARPVARKGVPESSGTSAKNVPGVKTFLTTSPPSTSLVILSSPSRITYRCSTGSPSRPFISPARTSFSEPCSTTHRSSSSVSPSKRGIRRRAPISASLCTLHLGQVSVDELDRDRSLPYTRGYPLHGAVPDIAGDEDAWYACLQEVWIPIFCPVLGPLAVPYQVWSREDKAPLVELYDAIQPLRLRRRPDKDKERASRGCLLITRL